MNVNKTIITGMCIAFLSACGGGGGDSPSTTPVQSASPSQIFSDEQEQVNEFVAAGLVLQTLAPSDTAYLMGFLGTIIQGLAADTGGNLVKSMTCGSGTGSLEVNKVTPHTGLTVGDKLSLTFAKCTIGPDIVDGALTLILRAEVSPSTDIDVSYDASMTLFSITTGGVETTFNGPARISTTMKESFNSIKAALSVPLGPSFFKVVKKGMWEVVYSPGDSFSATESGSPNSASRQMEATVLFADADSYAHTFNIRTPSPLVGTINSSGLFIPTSGVLVVIDLASNLFTSTTVSGINAQVSADSDHNGTRDLNFTVLVSTLLE